MKKEDILKASREENKNRDLAELDANARAGSIAGRVGATMCCVISLLASVVASTVLYSPWIIYFCIMGTNWLVRGIKLKKKSEFVLALTFLLFAALALAGLVGRLTEVRV